jgi:hypothetical protein
MTYALDLTNDALATAKAYKQRCLEFAAKQKGNTREYYLAKADAHQAQVDLLELAESQRALAKEAAQ